VNPKDLFSTSQLPHLLWEDINTLLRSLAPLTELGFETLLSPFPSTTHS